MGIFGERRLIANVDRINDVLAAFPGCQVAIGAAIPNYWHPHSNAITFTPNILAYYKNNNLPVRNVIDNKHLARRW